MTDTSWFVAADGKQEGPYSDQQFRELIAQGRVRENTLIWNASMAGWTRAADVPGVLSASFAPPIPQTGGVQATGMQAGGMQVGDTAMPLATTVPVGGLFGRFLLVVLGQMLIIPSPWTTTSFFRWFVGHIQLPRGEQAAFSGKPGDIWYIFMLNALCSGAGAIHNAAPLVLMPLTTLFSLIILRWVIRNLDWQGRSAPLRFVGGYWALLGWSLLFVLSVVTIIGWAWVATATARWMCRHIEGSRRRLIFTASGWSYLWRAFLFVLSCALLIPIPWTLRWFTRWLISQFSLTNADAQA
jgi:hypothetical protein